MIVATLEYKREDFKHTVDVLRCAVVRRASGLNKGNDFPGRCRKLVQEGNEPRTEHNLHLLQNFILDQTLFLEQNNENRFCLFVF